MTRMLSALTALFTLSFALAPLVTQPFMGFRDDQLPVPQPDPLIQPAGYAFAIWGLIYSWLIVSAIFGLWKRADDPAWRPARRFLIPALAVGTPWLWIANQSAIWASLSIALMAICAVLALLNAPALFDRGWLRSPLALFAGWLTAATHVSLAVTLGGYGVWPGATGWSWIALDSTLVIGVWVQLRRADSPEYGMTLIWALIAIALDTRATSPDFAALTTAAIAVIAVLLALQAWRPKSFGILR